MDEAGCVVLFFPAPFHGNQLLPDMLTGTVPILFGQMTPAKADSIPLEIISRVKRVSATGFAAPMLEDGAVRPAQSDSLFEATK
jgi:hypothetical protein